jgi:hypothetical protein
MGNESKALGLAERMESERNGPWDVLDAAAELRRQHAEIESLLAQLAARVPDGWVPTDKELTDVYKKANGEDAGKAQPITTQRIFNAMRAMLSAAPAQQAPVHGEPLGWVDPIAKGKSFASVMGRAYAMCPTDLPHLQKMEWVASYYELNRPQQASKPMAWMYEIPGARKCVSMCKDTSKYKRPDEVETPLYTHTQQAREPMTEEQKRQSWINATIEQCNHENCYMRGIEDAERHHKIGEKQ